MNIIYDQQVTIYHLPSDIINYMINFMSPSTQYILITYFKLFRRETKKIFTKGIIGTDACKYNNIDLINLLINNDIYLNNSKISQIAAYHGSINILKEYYQTDKTTDKTTDDQTFINACIHGDIDILNWLKEKYTTWNINKFKTAGTLAAQHNKGEVVKWLHNSGFHLKGGVWSRFITNNNLEMLKWLYEQGYPVGDITYCKFNLDNYYIFKWLYTINSNFIEDESIYLIKFDLESITWLHDHGYKFRGNDSIRAVEFNVLETLKWMYHHGCPLHKICYLAAIRNQNKTIISWLYANNCPALENIYVHLIHYKMDIEFLKWCYELGLQVTPLTYSAAIRYQKLDILRWLHTIRIPWINFTFAVAIETGNQEIIQWLKTVGCPVNKYTIYAAVRINDLELIKSLKNDGIPWSAGAIKVAAKTNNLSLIKWLHIHGCPWDNRVIVQACKDGNLEILTWLHENGCPWNSPAAEEACRNNQVEILKYLIQHNCPFNQLACLTILNKIKTRLINRIKNAIDMKTDKIEMLAKVETMIIYLNMQ